MRTETWIAKRLFFSSDEKSKSTSRPAVRVALVGMIVGVVVMILTLCVVVGFKRTIMNQMAGFGAHIQVTSFQDNNTFELAPIEVSDSLLDALRKSPHIASAEVFCTKPGMVKTRDAFRGVVVKGTNYWEYFQQHLIKGHTPEQTNEVLLSQSMANVLCLDIDSTVMCYFVGEEMRVRKLHVAGIYRTGYQEWDDLFLIASLADLRQLNQWSDTMASGIEMLVDDLDHLDDAADNVYFTTVNHLQDNGDLLYTQTFVQQNPQIFSWLDLLDMNVVVIIVLMLCVAGFNMISGLIILILDSIQLIGTMKALGANNGFIRRIFITQSAMLVGKGLIWGNVIGLGLALVQYITHWIPLDPASYYVCYVPIAFPWWGLIGLNIGTLVISVLILLAPSAIVTRISPARVMHFE